MHIEYKKVLMKRIGVVAVCSLVFLIACEKISDYTIDQIEHPSLSISSHQETRIHELVYQIQSRNIEALKNSVTPELHEKIVTEPKYLEQLCSFSVHDKFHRILVLSGFFFLKIASTFLNSSFFPKPIKRRIAI